MKYDGPVSCLAEVMEVQQLLAVSGFGVGHMHDATMLVSTR
jgi:hypothetical protein